MQGAMPFWCPDRGPRMADFDQIVSVCLSQTVCHAKARLFLPQTRREGKMRFWPVGNVARAMLSCYHVISELAMLSHVINYSS